MLRSILHDTAHEMFCDEIGKHEGLLDVLNNCDDDEVNELAYDIVDEMVEAAVADAKTAMRKELRWYKREIIDKLSEMANR